MKSRAFTYFFTAVLILVLVYSVGRFLNRIRVAESHDEILAVIQSAMEAKSAAPIINHASESLFMTSDEQTYYDLFMALEGAGDLENISNINYEVNNNHWWPWIADMTVEYQLTAQYSRGSADTRISVNWLNGDWRFSKVELAIHTAIASLIAIPTAHTPKAS